LGHNRVERLTNVELAPKLSTRSYRLDYRRRQPDGFYPSCPAATGN
jgi:hypothetical protein